MPLTPAEKQRRYRERLKNNSEKEAESKRKDRERYQANKRLVRDLTISEHRAIKKKWRSYARQRNQAKALHIKQTSELSPPRLNSLAPAGQYQAISNADRRLSTPQLSTYREYTPSSNTSAASHGRKQVKRNGSEIIKDNINLKEQLEAINKTYEKYKERLEELQNPGTVQTNSDSEITNYTQEAQSFSQESRRKKIRMIRSKNNDHQIEKKKLRILEILERESVKEKCDDLLFFESLLPYMENIPSRRKLRLRSKIQDLILTEIEDLEKNI